MRRVTRFFVQLVVTGVISALLLPTVRAAELEEVVVTATKRAVDIQRVPISLTYVDQALLDATKSERIKDIQYYVPGLAFTGADINSFGAVSLRGISTQARINGFDLAIGVYVDGVYTGRGMSINQDLVDIDHVEVLRGPQDTLFGRNNIAGAILITTAKPTNEFQAYVETDVGNYDLLDVRGSLNLPLSDQLFVRMSAIKTTESGYITNIYNGENQKLNGQNSGSGRLQVRWQPSDRLTADFTYSHLSENRPITFEVPVGPGFPGPLTVNLNTPQFETRQIWSAAGNVAYRFDSGAILTWISAYTNGTSFFQDDDDGTPVAQDAAAFNDHNTQFTQEIRLNSPSNQRFRYIGGLYFLYQDAYSNHNIITYDGIGQPSLNSFFSNTAFFTPGVPVPSDIFKGTVWTDSYAAFGNLEYDLSDKLTVFAGMRYTKENKTLQAQATGLYLSALNVFLQGSPLFRAHVDQSATSPTVGFTVKPIDDLTTYAKWSRGFRSGGFNDDIYIPSSDITFKAETADTYELGVKSLLADRTVRLNADVFYTKYKDMQQETFIALLAGLKIANAASATLKGTEVELTAQPTDALNVGAGVSYVRGIYANFVTNANLQTGTPTQTYDGNWLQQAPQWTANINTTYVLPLSIFGKWALHTNVVYRGSQYFGPDNNPLEKSPGYMLANGRLSLTKGKWEFGLWEKNIFNRLYTTEQRDVTGYNQLWYNYGQPRTYGLSIAYRQ